MSPKKMMILSMLALMAICPAMAILEDDSFLRGNITHDGSQFSGNDTAQSQRRLNPNIPNAPYPKARGDLDIRFNKIPLTARGRTLRTLKNNDYPLRGRLAYTLKRTSTAESIMTNDDFALRGKNVNLFLRRIGGAPTYPNSNPNHPFWQKDFRAVVMAQVHRRRRGSPSQVMTLPRLWARFNIGQVAEAVNDEYPGFWQGRLLEQLFRENVQIDHSILPFRCVDDFIGLNFRMAKMNVWATEEVGYVNFRAKWTFGRPRPEEVAWLIHTRRINERYVPADLVRIIRSWRMRNPFQFTAYTNKGSPRHPSYPAMHSAASSASTWMPLVFNLTPAQLCEVRRVDYAVSYARTVAGVHYPSDNIAGLTLGKVMMEKILPRYLNTEYNANIQRVQAKLLKNRFDWAKFNPRTCRTS